MLARLLLCVGLLVSGAAWGQSSKPGFTSNSPATSVGGFTQPVSSWLGGDLRLYPRINGTTQLAKLEASTAPTVCMIGDSTVDLGNYVDPVTESQFARIQHWLKVKYPAKTFTFKDFSIGGTGLGNFPIVVTGFTLPSWYTNPSATWNSYVAAAGCTSVFISYGLNDTGYEQASTWNTVLTDIVAYSTIPDIIISTNIVANIAAGGGYATPAAQAGYLSNASLQRNVAWSGNVMAIAGLPPIGIIDVGRAFNELVLNRDPANQYPTWVVTSGSPIVAGTTTTATFNYPFTPSPGGDNTVDISVTNGSSWVASGSGAIYQFADSQGANLGVGTGFVVFTPTGGTNVYAQVYYSNGSAQFGANTNNWNAGTNTFHVSAKNGVLYASINGVQAINSLIPVMDAPLTPLLTINSPPNGTVVTINEYSIGTMRPTASSAPGAPCYGTLTSGLGPNSGNAINHVSSICLSDVYETAIADAFSDLGVGVGGNAVTLGNGTTATTQGSGDNSTKVATTAYADGAITTLKGAANSWSSTQTFGPVIGTVEVVSATSYTAVAADCGKTKDFTAASAITVTLPNNLAAGCVIALVQGGAAKVSVSYATGMPTPLNPHGFTGTYAAGSVIYETVLSNAGSAAQYVFSGDGS